MIFELFHYLASELHATFVTTDQQETVQRMLMSSH